VQSWLLHFKYFANLSRKSLSAYFSGGKLWYSHSFNCLTSLQNVQNLSWKNNWKESLKVLEKSLDFPHQPVGTLVKVDVEINRICNTTNCEETQASGRLLSIIAAVEEVCWLS